MVWNVDTLFRAKRIKMRELPGRRGRLCCCLRTRGGVQFKSAELVTITHHHKGKLCLATDDGRTITRVDRRDVDLIEKPDNAKA